MYIITTIIRFTQLLAYHHIISYIGNGGTHNAIGVHDGLACLGIVQKYGAYGDSISSIHICITGNGNTASWWNQDARWPTTFFIPAYKWDKIGSQRLYPYEADENCLILHLYPHEPLHICFDSIVSRGLPAKSYFKCKLFGFKSKLLATMKRNYFQERRSGAPQFFVSSMISLLILEPFTLNKCLDLFTTAFGWLLLDIGWFVLFLS